MSPALFAIRDVFVLDYYIPVWRAPMALAISAAFGVLGYATHGVNRSGAIAGTILAFLLYFSGGPPAFVTLLGVFVIAWVTTRIGHLRKAGMGLAENKQGRSAQQVLANVGAAAGCAVIGLFVPVFHVGAAAALAEAAADTASSECGQALGRRSYPITTLQRVDIGTDGGMSVPGTLAGIVAAVLIAMLAVASHWIRHSDLELVAIAGFLGTIADSLLGATVERRGIIGNNGVNFTSTLVAAAIAVVARTR